MNCWVPGTKISSKCWCMGQACDQHVMCMDHIRTDHVVHGPSRSHGEALPWEPLVMGAYMGANLGANLSDSNKMIFHHGVLFPI